MDLELDLLLRNLNFGTVGLSSASRIEHFNG